MKASHAFRVVVNVLVFPFVSFKCRSLPLSVMRPGGWRHSSEFLSQFTSTNRFFDCARGTVGCWLLVVCATTPSTVRKLSPIISAYLRGIIHVPRCDRVRYEVAYSSPFAVV